MGDNAQIKQDVPKEAPKVAPPDDSSLVGEFVRSAVYSGVQSPLNGLTQLADKTLGTDILPSVQFMEAPQAADFGTAKWHAQTAGAGVGMIAPFMLVAKGTRGGMAKLGFSADAAATSSALFNARNGLALTESAISGFAYDALMRPVDPSEGNFWAARLKHGAVGAATFTTLTASSIGLRSAAGSAFAEATRIAPVLRNHVSAGALSGIPAGLVSAEMDSVLGRGRHASAKELAQSAYGMAFVGGGLSAMHQIAGQPERGIQRSKDLGLKAEAGLKPVLGLSLASGDHAGGGKIGGNKVDLLASMDPLKRASLDGNTTVSAKNGEGNPLDHVKTDRPVPEVPPEGGKRVEGETTLTTGQNGESPLAKTVQPEHSGPEVHKLPESVENAGTGGKVERVEPPTTTERVEPPTTTERVEPKATAERVETPEATGDAPASKKVKIKVEAGLKDHFVKGSQLAYNASDVNATVAQVTEFFTFARTTEGARLHDAMTEFATQVGDHRLATLIREAYTKPDGLVREGAPKIPVRMSRAQYERWQEFEKLVSVVPDTDNVQNYAQFRDNVIQWLRRNPDLHEAAKQYGQNTKYSTIAGVIDFELGTHNIAHFPGIAEGTRDLLSELDRARRSRGVIPETNDGGHTATTVGTVDTKLGQLGTESSVARSVEPVAQVESTGSNRNGFTMVDGRLIADVPVHVQNLYEGNAFQKIAAAKIIADNLGKVSEQDFKVWLEYLYQPRAQQPNPKIEMRNLGLVLSSYKANVLERPEIQAVLTSPETAPITLTQLKAFLTAPEAGAGANQPLQPWIERYADYRFATQGTDPAQQVLPRWLVEGIKAKYTVPGADGTSRLSDILPPQLKQYIESIPEPPPNPRFKGPRQPIPNNIELRLDALNQAFTHYDPALTPKLLELGAQDHAALKSVLMKLDPATAAPEYKELLNLTVPHATDIRDVKAMLDAIFFGNKFNRGPQPNPELRDANRDVARTVAESLAASEADLSRINELIDGFVTGKIRDPRPDDGKGGFGGRDGGRGGDRGGRGGDRGGNRGGDRGDRGGDRGDRGGDRRDGGDGTGKKFERNASDDGSGTTAVVPNSAANSGELPVSTASKVVEPPVETRREEPPVVVRDETQVVRDETQVVRDETQVVRDETQVVRDETQVVRDDVREQPVVSNEGVSEGIKGDGVVRVDAQGKEPVFKAEPTVVTKSDGSVDVDAMKAKFRTSQTDLYRGMIATGQSAKARSEIERSLKMAESRQNADNASFYRGLLDTLFEAPVDASVHTKLGAIGQEVVGSEPIVEETGRGGRGRKQDFEQPDYEGEDFGGRERKRGKHQRKDRERRGNRNWTQDYKDGRYEDE